MFTFPPPVPKPKSPNTPCVRKIRKKEGLLAIVSAVALAMGTYVDGFPGIEGSAS